MGSSAGKEEQPPPPQWREAGRTVPDPRDPPDEEGAGRNFDFGDRVRRQQPERAAPTGERGIGRPSDPSSGAGGGGGGNREFIRVGDRLENKPMDKLQHGLGDPKREKFKAPVDKKKLRGTVATEKQPGATAGRQVLNWEEVDNTSSYVVISKPQMLVEDAEPYNKRPLPTFRRGADVAELDEEELEARREAELLPLEQQVDPGVNIDGLEIDAVGYQARLDPLPLLLPRKANVPREDYLGTACGQDVLGVEDDGYARDVGRLPNGERINLLRIISQY
ncbi:hypothetical protein BOX15_Mlig009272g1 [Macrostomum lignano]|uniref:Uncharacterized protein n=1 Tax=Macrostomum lignano TaxID=282301 RepID=A0A267E5K4_9PLAT|nr:hypothetical protein BOX15_Mlig033879g1 [Macrostomum lignano]PAA56214.1 hypothetical protein BOX15_Mlig009272g1 [Macrostomum lignano]